MVDDDGRLVGAVSRGDLLKIYLRPGGDIVTRLVPAGSANVQGHVGHGLVRLEGEVPGAVVAEGLVRAARTVPGAVDVTSRLHSRAPVRRR
ncbi:hypothetical protein [Streptomyces sp. NBC_01276]|uniref:hypothetical protein n=1 Tax=Streptomyces sp. NBC_01276 TaxID=2903808 RepID=UPI00352CDAB4